MRILLGSLCNPILEVSRMPILALYRLAALGRARGYHVDVFDPRGPRTAAFEPRQLDRYDLIGLNTNTFSWAETLQWVKTARQEAPQVPIVLGGVHASFCDEHCLRASGAHYVVRFEGEDAFVALCEYLDGCRPLDSVPNLSRLDRHGHLVRHEQAPLLAAEYLENLPQPALDLVPPGVYEHIPVETSRGCAFDCWFCGIPFHGRWRGFSTAGVMTAVDHALSLRHLFTGSNIFFADDCFSIQPRRTTELLDALPARGSDTGYGFEVRIRDVLHDGLLERFDRVRCNFLQVGVEVGYDEGLRRLRKGLTTAEVMEFARRVRDMSFHAEVWWSFILGFPWETMGHIKATIEFAYRVALMGRGSAPHFGTFVMLPGSTAYVESAAGLGLGASTYDDPRWLEGWCKCCTLSEGERQELDSFARACRTKFRVWRTYDEVARSTNRGGYGGPAGVVEAAFPEGERRRSLR